MSILDLDYNYAGLSLQDLLEARALYHFHLLNKANVVGTAVGYYLIRKEEDWPRQKGEGRNPKSKRSEPRTLFNSEVRDYSWPCILAFVRQWAPQKAFAEGATYRPEQIVPKTLYMPDGRAVPVCVVEIGDEQPHGPLPPVEGPRPAFPLGGGCPIIVDTQGQRHTATAGCLVTDGHTTYVLTARHACGEPGQTISSILREGEQVVGVSSPKQLTRQEFETVYPSYPGRRAYCAMDVGLVRLDRVADWTASTYALPPVGPLADINEGNLSLRLIDQPVVGYGAASGLLRGSIKALFYRHRSVGGFDYVGDFLIAPDDGQQTRPGDSGMVWHLDLTPGIRETPDIPVSQRILRPLAMEWGGQVLGSGEGARRFAVATSLSSVCRMLDVELVSDVGRGVSGYWGRTGHYSIAALAISQIRNAKLKKLMQANSDILSFDLAKIADTGFDKSVGQLSGADEFVPLADVPDEIWKKLSKAAGGRTGGRDTSGGQQSNGPEHPNHYADIDAPGSGGKTLLQLCRADPDSYLKPEAWSNFYADMAQRHRDAGEIDEARQYASKLKQGLLPFRLWQYFDAMVAFLKAGDVEGYLTAAGTAAHYTGDASQPLHGSVLADGNKALASPRVDPKTGEPFIYGNGVHSAYETKMVSRYAGELISQAQAGLAHSGKSLPLCKSGAQYARAVIELMHSVARKLPPQKILQEFENAGGAQRVATFDAMYGALGKPTAAVLAEGARYLALLWDSAWVAGGGAGVAAGELVAREPKAIRKRYISTAFVKSVTLDQIEKLLVMDGAPASRWKP